MIDSEIIEGLKEIDESDEINCDDYECSFLDSIKKMKKPRILSTGQRKFAEKLI